MAAANQLVYITGSGRSGSTLLDMILDGHSEISALGEVHRVYLNAHRISKAHRCTCGKVIGDCDRWQQIAALLAKRLGIAEGLVFKSLVTTDPAYLDIRDDHTGLNIVEPVPQHLYRSSFAKIAVILGNDFTTRTLSIFSRQLRLQQEIFKNSVLLYDAVRDALKTPIVVDSTKTPVRLKGLHANCPCNFRVIYLVRDGRAVSFARMKRQRISMSEAARIWRAEHRKIRLALFMLPSSSVFRISYEDLCASPQAEATRLCDFLGVEFQPSMLNFREPIRHSLGGNPMRWRSEESVIKLNEEWRSGLNQQQLAEFEEIAGSCNRTLGYE